MSERTQRFCLIPGSVTSINALWIVEWGAHVDQLAFGRARFPPATFKPRRGHTMQWPAYRKAGCRLTRTLNGCLPDKHCPLATLADVDERSKNLFPSLGILTNLLLLSTMSRT